jgi:succinoglycan biosynthesis transport protein ExoP
MDQVPKRFDINDYASAFRKRKWLIVGVSLCALFIGFGLTRVAEPMFRAESIVLVKSEARPALLLNGQQTRLHDPVALETETLRAQTMQLAQAAAQQYITLVGTAEPQDIIANRLHQSLSAIAQEPNIIHLQATANDPDVAVRFAKAAADAFQDTHEGRSLKGQVLIAQQVTGARDALRELEDDLAEFQQAHGIINLEADTSDAVKTLTQYRTWLAEAEADRSAAEASAQNMVRRLGSEQPLEELTKAVPSPALLEIDRLLGEKEAALTEARARYTDEYWVVEDIVAEVAELRAERDRRKDERVLATEHVGNPLYASLRGQAADLDAEAAGLKRRADVVNGILRDHVAGIRELPKAQAELQRRIAERDIARDAFRTLLERQTEVLIEDAVEENKVEVLDYAAGAVQIAPQTTRTMIFALVVGLLASLGLALVLELTDVTIHSPEDLQGDLQLPFLGMVPVVDDRADDHLVTAKAPKSPPAEAYRTLRSNINFSLLDQPAKTFLITSAGAGEGKSMTAANLAVAMAQAGRSVIIVDSDMRRPELHQFYETPGSPGLTDLLTGEASLSDVLHETGIPNLRLIPSGAPPPNPAELLSSDRMGEVLKELERESDVCILDSPPVLAVTDAMVLSARVDQTVLVAESGRVTKDAFREMKRLIQTARGNILGVVINKMRPKSSDYYYYYYYSADDEFEESNGHNNNR